MPPLSTSRICIPPEVYKTNLNIEPTIVVPLTWTRKPVIGTPLEELMGEHCQKGIPSLVQDSVLCIRSTGEIINLRPVCYTSARISRLTCHWWFDPQDSLPKASSVAHHHRPLCESWVKPMTGGIPSKYQITKMRLTLRRHSSNCSCASYQSHSFLHRFILSSPLAHLSNLCPPTVAGMVHRNSPSNPTQKPWCMCEKTCLSTCHHLP